MTFSTTKIRGGREMTFTSPIDWDSLRISPQSIEQPEAKETVKKHKKAKPGSEPEPDSGADLPWNT